MAVGEPAAAIADVERRAQGLRDGPASSADVEDGTVVVFHDPWDHGITGQPAGGLRGQEAVPIEITAGAVFNLVIPVGFIGVDVQDQFATARPVQSAGRWWLLTPQRQPFFSLGLNHIDPATMRYPENIERWRDWYGSSTIRWIEESVAPHLRQWGFNTVGWVQEATVGQWQHSRSFTPDEYRALGMPYCHLLPFTESHQWEANVRHYDYDSSEWETWCDHVARSQVVDLCDDPNLIGYFYSDCPTWVHDAKPNKWRGPIFDPDLLASASGRKELRRLATRYYETTHDAIRRYDPHHLILGDRYEANAALPMEVIDAALPLVDVLSFQDFVDPVSHLREWYEKTERPVLLADAAHLEWHRKPTYARNDGHRYARTLADLR